MILDISPTRMELLKLKKKLGIARKGHKLLKDKLDELIRIIFILVKEVSVLREKIDKKISEADKMMAFAGYSTFPEASEAAFITSERKLEIKTGYKQLLNLKVPDFEILPEEKTVRSYGFVQTSTGTDKVVDIFDEIAKDIVVLSQKEKTVQMIAEEIQKTRRRVNALEYILIPNLEETLKFISMKLEEQERNTQTQLMRIKDIVRAPQSPTTAHPGIGKYPL